MERFEKGMLVKSKAGHDKGKVYVIFQMDEKYVYLVDGKLKTLAKPKKKKYCHVQVIQRKYDITEADDTAVKRILKMYNREEA